MNGQHHKPAALPPGINYSAHLIGDLVRPTPRLDILEKRSHSCLSGIRPPDRPVRSLVGKTHTENFHTSLN